MSSASDPKPVVTGYPAGHPPPAGAAAAYPTAGTDYTYSAPPPHAGRGAGYSTAYPTTSTAYAYPAPPPHAAPYYPAAHPNGAAPPQAFYGASARPHAFLLRRLFAIVVGVFLVVGLATLILWLVLRPRLPAFALTSVSASVSAFNVSAPQQSLSSDFDLAFSVRNPNHKMGIYYDNVVAAVLYGFDRIADTSLAPFYQAKGNETTVRARLLAESDYVDPSIVKGIAADRGRGAGAVNFNIRVFSSVRFRAGAWRTKWHMLRVYCDDVSIEFKNATAIVGSMVGPPKQCDVNL